MSGQQRALHTASSGALNSVCQALEEVKDRLRISEQKKSAKEAALQHILALQNAQNELVQVPGHFEASKRHALNQGVQLVQRHRTLCLSATLARKLDIEWEKDRQRNEEHRRLMTGTRISWLA